MTHSRRLRNPLPNETAVAGVNGEGHRPQPVSTQVTFAAPAASNSRRSPRLASPAMPRKRKTKQPVRIKLDQPCAYVVAGEKWPRGPLVVDAPKEALLAQGIANKILDELKKRETTAHAVASRRGISSETLYKVLDGTNWPNFVTVARLEIHFNRRLWGNEHKPRRRKPRN